MEQQRLDASWVDHLLVAAWFGVVMAFNVVIPGPRRAAQRLLLGVAIAGLLAAFVAGMAASISR